jgi:threonyl-tRNA synthetase
MPQKDSGKIVAKKGLSFADALKAAGVKNAIAALVDGAEYDLSTIAKQDTTLEPIFPDSPRGLKILRHSTAHLLAQAVLELFPEARPNAGPPTDDGFYYDIDMKPVNQEDLERIEERMHQIASRNIPVKREELSREELLKLFAWNQYKLDKVMENVPEGGSSTVYRQGDFVDFCRGPHVPSTGYLKAFRLLSIASTHYKADESRPMLVRIYGTSFPDEKSLKEYLKNREEALKRDHRKIAQEMDLLVFNSERAPGFPFYTPNGMIIRQELLNFMARLNRQYGWEEVSTPHIYRDVIWKQSGHYAKYKPNMYLFTLSDGDSYGVKPMNCPGHITIFERTPKSYRELPVKYCEPGTVYRYEKSGEVGGLTRPRMFTIDDGHGFMRFDQIVGEVKSIMEMVKATFSGILGHVDMTFDLSVIDKNSPENYLITYHCNRCGTDVEARKAAMEEELVCPNCGSTDLSPDFSTWDTATDQLRQALDESGLEYAENPGEAAFYGPKIDVHVRDALGRMWQLSTIQVDFFMPTNFGLYYINSESKHDRIIMIHRAIFGSYERFMAILIEHFAGKFPTWLAPLQAYIVPVSEKFNDYAIEVEKVLKWSGIRARADIGTETMNKKIKIIRQMRPSYILVVGEREEQGRSVSVRNRKDRTSVIALDEFREKILKEIEKCSVEQTI